MARPRLTIPLDEVERLAARGLDKRQICHALGISPDTLWRREADDKRVTEALERGRARGLADVASALFERALSGDTRAQIYYLRSRGGWTEPAPRSSDAPSRDDDLELEAYKRPSIDMSPATVRAILNASYGKPTGQPLP